jgi:hypothetical protein
VGSETIRGDGKRLGVKRKESPVNLIHSFILFFLLIDSVSCFFFQPGAVFFSLQGERKRQHQAGKRNKRQNQSIKRKE